MLTRESLTNILENYVQVVETKDDATVFGSIIVVTDRRILDKQIRDTFKSEDPYRFLVCADSARSSLSAVAEMDKTP